MQRTLEDEETCGQASLSVPLNPAAGNIDGDAAVDMEVVGRRSNRTTKAGLSASAQKFDQGGAETSSEDGSATEKHKCDIRSQDDENTQEAEFPNDDGLFKGGFGSDINGVGTSPVVEGDADGTERVLETESPGIDTERNIDLNKHDNVAGDTMQLENDTNVQETEPRVPMTGEDSPGRSQLSSRDEAEKATDVEPEGIRTQDLLASEGLGSWACSTAPSIYGDNESPHVDEREADAVMRNSNAVVAESQNSALPTKMHTDVERQALSNMIGIMAPDVKEQFGSIVGKVLPEESTLVPDSDSETDDECIEASKNIVDESGSDEETQADDQVDKKEEDEDEMEEDDDDTQEDSVG